MHVYQEDFIDRIKKITSKYDINPKLIPLEITESAFTSEESSLYRKIKSLQDCGYRFSMDDFGSGYSSLGMLKDEHVDEVKIDKTFVDDIATDKGRILLKNVIQMIGALGIDMIAEGVETKEQADFLVNIMESDLSKEATLKAYHTIFKTTCGKTICKEMFGI